MKRIIKITFLVILLVALITLTLFSIPGLVIADNNPSSHINSWTKALCNETSCQDYVIYCDGSKFVNQTAITGAVISIPSGWEDPRNETMRERVCGGD